MSTAAGGVDWKARVDHILRPRTGAGRIEGRVLQQPDQFGRLAACDRGRASRHGHERLLVGDQAIAHVPFDRG